MSTPRPFCSRTGRTPQEFLQALRDHLYFTRGSSVQSASAQDALDALCITVRDYLMDRWRDTVQTYYDRNPKFVYYLSAEYLLGRQLPQNLDYTATRELAREALTEAGVELDDLVALDAEPGLGNGGLGRLAACFLDSLATLDVPAVGYGIRYEYGIFEQTIQDGWQVERPDHWLQLGNPWEFPQPDDMVEVGFGGQTEYERDGSGRLRVCWRPELRVRGEPCHTMVPGYGTRTVNMLRLWRARATKDFDFQLFNVGDYARAVEQKVRSENLTKVLYPNDEMPQGKELRLKQQYFFVACSLHDIIRRYRLRNDDWSMFPDKVAIQLNDTHPVIAIPELMRLLLDEHGLDWDAAWDITQRTFAYTCHTLLPEALEKWPVDLLGRLLPRHLELIYEINRRFLEEVEARHPGDDDRLRRMSIIEEGAVKQVRMAHLATIGSHSVNGVAEIQSRLLVERVLPDFHQRWPERFNNKTNGVTPRRFIAQANPRLAALITERLGGDGWLRDLELLRGLEPHAGKAELHARWREVKHENKRLLAGVIRDRNGIRVDPDSIFDVMVKRLHEYKRQLLKALHIVTLYGRLLENPGLDMVPRTFVFGAKAAPGYHMAKRIIQLIHAIGAVVNHHPTVRDRLKVAFLANFNVSLGEVIYPAADISEQISMAGKEASGTGNMKFALNGALTTGTLDGANIEIRDRVGAENFFLFGLTADEVFSLKAAGYRPRDHYESQPELRAAIDRIAAGEFSGGDRDRYRPIVDSLLEHDEYLLLADFASYVECQDRAEEAWRDPDRWTRMSILNTARCGHFSSDRTIREYCEEIWGASPVPVGEAPKGS